MTLENKKFIDKMFCEINKKKITSALKMVILAQSILESGYGEKGVNTRGATNNVFAINWYNDKYTKNYKHVGIMCSQYDKSKEKYTFNTEEFCIFDSLSDAIDCLINWYDRPKYKGIKDSDKTTSEITAMLVGNYATSPVYKKSLDNLIDRLISWGYVFEDSSKWVCVGSFEFYNNARLLSFKVGGFIAKRQIVEVCENDKKFYRVLCLCGKKELKWLENHNIKYWEV